MEKKQIGFVILSETICDGLIISCRGQDDQGDDTPLVFNTYDDAWREIADMMVMQLEQFIKGTRPLEHTSFATDEFVGWYTEYVDGSFQVHDSAGDLLINSTIHKWKNSI